MRPVSIDEFVSGLLQLESEGFETEAVQRHLLARNRVVVTQALSALPPGPLHAKPHLPH